jgi:hypothetical protein
MAEEFYEDTAQDVSWNKDAVIAQFALVPGVSLKGARILYECGYHSVEALAAGEPIVVWKRANEFANTVLSNDMINGLRCLRDKEGKARAILSKPQWKKSILSKRKRDEEESRPPPDSSTAPADEEPKERKVLRVVRPDGKAAPAPEKPKKKLTSKQRVRQRRLAKRHAPQDPGPKPEPPAKRRRL